MKPFKLRDKLLLFAITFIFGVTLVAMSVVSLVIGNQYLGQSEAKLQKAVGVIQNNLDDRRNGMLLAGKQLASQRNLGSTLWYLGKYGVSDEDRAMLEITYQQLAKDVYKTALVANLDKVALYDASGSLVSFASRAGDDFQVGYARKLSVPRFFLAKLQPGDDINRNNLAELPSYGGFDFHYRGELPSQAYVRFTTVNGKAVMESFVPIVGEVFDAGAGGKRAVQLGCVVAAQELDQAFIEHMAMLAEVSINIFTGQGYSLGSLPDYKQLPVNVQFGSALGEVAVGDETYYQRLVPLFDGDKRVATIAAMQSEKIVQQNIWQLMRTLGLIGLVALLAMLPFVWYFASSISQPLHLLGRIFRGTASGAPDHAHELVELKKEAQRNDELGELTKSFIQMSDALREKGEQNAQLFASLKESRDELESRVAERTKELVALKLEAERMARTDLLTGLPNRRAFYEQAGAIVAQAQRYQHPLSLVMLDIDHFKSINDTYGHGRGDSVLQAVAGQIAAAARTSDVAARQGGEEFVILLPETELDAAAIFAERLRVGIEEMRIDARGTILSVTCSLGVARLSVEDADIDALLRRSDAALYRAKGSGRNRVSCDEAAD